MIDESESPEELDTSLTRLCVSMRAQVQDFPLCSTIKEVESLNSLVRQDMDRFRENLAKLELAAMEQMDLEEGERLRELCSGHARQLTEVQGLFRQANVRAMGVLERQASSQLLSTQGEQGRQLRQRRDKEQLVAEHSQVTQNLQAISRQLAETVARSKDTVGVLGDSTSKLGRVIEEQRTMGGVIGMSKRLINKYARREFTDKVLILFALAFFFAVVLYILRKRLFPSFGPIEVIFYLLGSAGNALGSLTSIFG